MNERVLVDQELFLGRIDEQKRFRSLLEDVLNTSHRGLLRKSFSVTSEWSHMVLLYGTGGMGKTTLCKRLRDIAIGSPPDRRYYNKFTIIWLDWEVLREKDRRLAVHDAVTFEMILDHLYNAFCTAGFMREFNSFDQKRVHLNEVETHVAQILNSHTEDAEDHYGSLRKLGSEGLTILVRKELPQVDAFFSQEEMVNAAEEILRAGTDGLSYLRSQAGEWLGHHLKADDRNLFTSPRENLARAFAQGVRAVTRSRPLIIFLDTYEIIDKIDPWLRLIIAQSGLRTVWVLSGRDNLVESRRYGPSYFIGYQGEAPAERLRTFPMSEFNQNDIITFFAEKVPTRPLTVEQATAVQHATYGIPMAVNIAAALWGGGTSLEALIEGIPERANRETIVKAMTDRLLVHARADTDHPQDIFHLYALALAYQPDYDLLAALWEGEDVRRILDDMERRYEFVFAHSMRLHEVVRDFLREYLLAEVERRSPPIQSINKRAISVLEQRLASIHGRLHTLEARLEDDYWMKTTLALIWHRLWLDEEAGWKTLQIVFLAALAYDRDLGRILLDMADFFAVTWSKSRKQRLKSLYAIFNVATSIENETIILDIFEQALSGEDIQPDQGCATEFAAIVSWLRGRAVRQQGLVGEALEVLSEAGRQVPEKAQVLRVKLSLELRLLGDELSYAQNRYEEAISVLNQAVELNPKSSRTWHSLGHVYQHQGRIQEAIGAFEKADTLDPRQSDNWLCLGNIYKGQGQLDKAISAFQHGLECNKDEKRQAKLWYCLGEVYRQQNKVEQSVKSLKEATVLDPQATVPWDSLGHVYEDQGQLEEAIKAFQKAIKRSENGRQKCGYLCCLGDLYLNQKRLEEAARFYNQAKVLDPNSGRPWHRLGHVYERKGQLDEAIKALKLAHSLDPKRSDHLSCLGKIYLKTKQLDEAADAFMKAIEREKKSKTRSSIWNQVSRLYQRQGKIEEAINASKQSTALDPTKFNYWLFLGDLLRKQNRLNEAINAYSKGIELAPQELSDNSSIVGARQFLEEYSDQ